MGVRVSEKRKKDKLGNRMALLGIAFMVISMTVVVNLRGTSLKNRELQYQMKEETLQKRLEQEEQRAEQLEEQGIHVQTRQYIKKVAKKKLGLVGPDEILLKLAE